jgi:hypothetical protein
VLLAVVAVGCSDDGRGQASPDPDTISVSALPAQALLQGITQGPPAFQ